MADEPLPPADHPIFLQDPQEPPHEVQLPASDPLPPKPAGRGDDIQRAADAGRARAEREGARKAALKQAKTDELKKDRSAMNEGLEKQAAEKQKKKGFRIFKKRQDQEIVEDKLRREKQSAFILAGQKARTAKRKIQEKYMGELHENARIKQAMEARENALKLDAEKERTKAEREYRRGVEEAERLCVLKKEDIERDTRSKKFNEETELRGRLYQEEARFRSRMSSFEGELKRQQAPVRTPVEAQRQKNALDASIRPKKKRLEDDHKEQQGALEREARQKMNDLETGMYSSKAQADAELRQKMRSLEIELARRLNDIEYTYRKRLGESRTS